MLLARRHWIKPDSAAYAKDLIISILELIRDASLHVGYI